MGAVMRLKELNRMGLSRGIVGTGVASFARRFSSENGALSCMGTVLRTMMKDVFRDYGPLG